MIVSTSGLEGSGGVNDKEEYEVKKTSFDSFMALITSNDEKTIPCSTSSSNFGSVQLTVSRSLEDSISSHSASNGHKSKINVESSFSTEASNKSKCNEGVGDRLYQKGLETERKKAELRKQVIAAEIESNKLHLATEKRKSKRTIANSNEERYNSLYKLGKSKVEQDRARKEKQRKEEAANVPKWMTWTPKKHIKDPSSVPFNDCQNRLYALSKEKQLLGKQRREEVERNCQPKGPSSSSLRSSSTGSFRSMKDENIGTPRYLQLYESGVAKLIAEKEKEQGEEVAPGRKKVSSTMTQSSETETWNRLYSLSQAMQEDGKGRRMQILQKDQGVCRVTIFSDPEQFKNW